MSTSENIEYNLVCSPLMQTFHCVNTRSLLDVWKSVSHEEGRHKMASRKRCLVAGAPKWKLVIIYSSHPIFQGTHISTVNNIAKLL